MLDPNLIGEQVDHLGCTVRYKTEDGTYDYCLVDEDCYPYGVDTTGEWVDGYVGHAVCEVHRLDPRVVEVTDKGETTLLQRVSSDPIVDEPRLILTMHQTGAWDYDDYFGDVDVDEHEYWHDDPDTARDLRDDR